MGTDGVKLSIIGEGREWTETVRPAGTVIGRRGDCGVVLKHRAVSGRHARMYMDPFGRWIVEDLGSRNGTSVDGRRVTVHALLPGQQVHIGPYVLAVSYPSSMLVAGGAETTGTAFLSTADADVGGELTVGRGQALSCDRLTELNDIIDDLLAVPSSGQLYRSICRRLARESGGKAAVVRLPAGEPDEADRAAVLACSTDDGPAGCASETIRLSRRVLRAVRSTDQAVMAASHPAGGAPELTAVDEDHPRNVYCAAIGEAEDASDVLYLDMPARRAPADMLDFFQAVARQVGFAAKGLLLAEERARRQVLDEQLRRAREIQLGLTPRTAQASVGVDVACHYQPAEWVGGDYCDVWPLADGRVALAVGDVRGHGLDAAMVMTSLHAVLRTTMAFRTISSEIMDRVGEHLLEHMPEDMLATFFLGLYDPAGGTLEYVNAGHLPPLVAAPGGQVSRLGKPRHLPLGIRGGSHTAEIATLDPGQLLMVFTDGICETRNNAGEEFGLDGLAAALGAGEIASAQAAVRAIMDAVGQFRQSLPFRDDVTILALHRPASEGADA